MAFLLFVSFGSGDGGASSLQTAYEGGNTIDVVDGTPVLLQSAADPTLYAALSPEGISVSLDATAFTVGGADDAVHQSIVVRGASLVTHSNDEGEGGSVSILGGTGRTALNNDGDGGPGGELVVQTGAGGASVGEGEGGDGGTLTVTTGTGGSAPGAERGGAGGFLVVTSGDGGASTGGDRGDGGPISISSGHGDSGGDIIVTAGNGDFISGSVALQGGVLTVEDTGSFSRVGCGPAVVGGGGPGAIIAGSAVGEEGGTLNGSDISLGGGLNVNSGFTATNTGGYLRLGGGIANGDPTSLGGDVILTSGQGGAVGGGVFIAAGFGLNGLTSGKVSIGLNGTIGLIAEVDGGVLFDTNGVVYLRTHDIGEAGSGNTTGSLSLHVLTDDEEARIDPLTDGLIHYRTTVDEGTVRMHGFRSREAEDWALMARGYQESFVGDGVTTQFDFTHNLNTVAPIVMVYSQGESLEKVLDSLVSIRCLNVETSRLIFQTPPADAEQLYVTIIGF